MNREEKRQQIEELKAMFAESAGIYLTGFKGLTVEHLSELRREFRKAEVGYRVVKNTLARKALEGTELADLAPLFEGCTAVAFAKDDPVAPAKIMKDFMKGHEQLTCKGGFMDGELFAAEDLERISKLPSRDELRSMLLSVVIGVPRGIVTVMSEVPSGLVRVINARKEQLEGNAEAA